MISISNKNTLKHQFRKQLAISMGLLVIIFSVLLHKIFFIGIGTTMHRTMAAMASHYAKQVEHNPLYKLPNGDDYFAYVGKANVPDKIHQLFNIDGVKDFEFKVKEGDAIFNSSPPDEVYFLFAHPLIDSQDKLYLLYNEKSKHSVGPPSKNSLTPPPKKGPRLNVPISIAFITLLSISLVYWVAQRLISKVLNPINELALMASSLDENNPELSFGVMNDKTEIGVVANTLHQTMGRIHDFHQREKQFLQNASHELRTPIAVVSSALDIIDLRASQGNSNVFDQHVNIRIANKNMAEITDALLLLSRKSSAEVTQQVFALGKLLVSIVNENQYLLKSKDVDIEIIADNLSLYNLPQSLCRITLSNLIRNAFEHTSSGMVRIVQNELDITITNTSRGMEYNSGKAMERGFSQGKGFGIGLDIVKKIVDQQKWQLNFSADEYEENEVNISFMQQTDDCHQSEIT